MPKTIDYSGVADELATERQSYLQKVQGDTQHFTRLNPNDPRFSQQADDKLQLRAMGVSDTQQAGLTPPSVPAPTDGRRQMLLDEMDRRAAAGELPQDKVLLLNELKRKMAPPAVPPSATPAATPSNGVQQVGEEIGRGLQISGTSLIRGLATIPGLPSDLAPPPS